MDYSTLIDPPTWAFIKATDDAYPPDAASFSIAEQRAVYDRMCRVFHRGYPPGVKAEDRVIAGVPCRIFAGAAPAILYLHGGGYVVGGLESHDDICADIRAATGLTVVCADYRLSPEHLHPAALEDALNVARALAKDGPILLAGDSAGGNLAASAAHVLRHEKVRILGQVLIYPGLGGDMDRGSYISHANAPMLTRADVQFYAGIRHGGTAPKGDPTVSPLQDNDFSNLPPTVTFGAECDPLCDDARAYAEAISGAGGRAHWIVEPGLVHAYLRARTTVPRAEASFARITAALSALARGEWPYGDAE
ncbi:alpha/beta hydrolase fold domain-containing protein [bacterium]|nr:alpha/beta hydrolase fold domain-containing protein [bacterium]